MVEARIAANLAVLYLEVVEPAEIARLQSLLRIHLANPGVQLDPAEAITSTSGPRGTYWSTSLKVKVNR